MQSPKKELKIEEDNIIKALISLLAAFFLLVLIHMFIGSYSYNLTLYADPNPGNYFKPPSNWLDYHCPLDVSHYKLSFDGYHEITPEEFKDDTIFSNLFSGYKITASLSFALEGHWTFILVATILIFIIIKLFDNYTIKIT